MSMGPGLVTGVRRVLEAREAVGHALRVQLAAGQRIQHITQSPAANAGCERLKPRCSLSLEGIRAALEAAAQARRRNRAGPAGARRGAGEADRAVRPERALGGAYFPVHRRADRRRPAVAAFVDWITRENAERCAPAMGPPLPQLAELVT
jgi:hypothetical protein